jgi:hypothetical protein
MPEGIMDEKLITEEDLIGHIETNEPYFFAKQKRDISLERTIEKLSSIIEIQQARIESLIVKLDNQHDELIKKGETLESINASIDSLSAAKEAMKQGKNDKAREILKNVKASVGGAIKDIVVGVLTNLLSGKLG